MLTPEEVPDPASTTTSVPIRKILVLAASPEDQVRLNLEKEVREIDVALRLGSHREQFDLEQRWGVSRRDLQDILLNIKPDIVHFCGHGAKEHGLVLQDDNQKAQLASTAALAELFEIITYSKPIACIVLNACYAEVQANAISPLIDYIVGMKQEIGDKAAIEFSKGFYRSLSEGLPYDIAFRFGKNAIALDRIPEDLTPVLRGRKAPPDPIREFEPNPASSPARVFISYRSQSPDKDLAQEFHRSLQAAGHVPFLAGESIRLGENWAERIDRELEQSDYFLLLLSEQSAVSEMVTEEVRRAKQLRDRRPDGKLMILPIRVNFPMDAALNYDLRGYLQQIQQREWRSPADTSTILQEVLALVGIGQPVEQVEIREAVAARQDSPDLPPLPIAEPELYREPGGSVPLDSGLYSSTRSR